MSAVTKAVLYCNGKFLTLSPSKPTAEAVASYGGRIIRVGERKECIDAFPPGVRFDEVDLQGCVALPGFRDSHVHLLS
ncbi:MAG TPA: amidohydrolase, partial [Firmicutes bacterium]|nr:amidohydrolase [Candidatus Fermentithermobacillaceae bacterium]